MFSRLRTAIAATLLIIAAATAPVAAQGLVLANSDPVVAVHSNFAGQSFTLFGAIDPAAHNLPADTSYDVVMVIKGPPHDQRVSMKGRELGVVLTTDMTMYKGVPSYYAILSNRPLNVILPEGLNERPDFSLLRVVEASHLSGPQELNSEFVRIKSKGGTYSENAMGVVFLSRTGFAARISLPSHVSNGLYIAQAYLYANGELITETTTRFAVRTEGFERMLVDSARNHSLLYGLAAAFLALFTGWLGGVVFRR